MIPSSIQFRLQLWHGLILAGVLAGFGLFVYRNQRDGLVERVDAELQTELRNLLRAREGGIGSGPPREEPSEGPPSRHRVSEIKGEVSRNVRTEGAVGRTRSYYVFFDDDGSVLARSAAAPPVVPMPSGTPRQPGDGLLIPMQSEGVEARWRGSFREVYRILPLGDALLAGREMRDESSALYARMAWLALVALVLLVCGLAGGWWITGHALRPVGEISRAAEQIAGGADLSLRIDMAGPQTELSRMAAVLNSTFERLQKSFERQARFTSDASHELRTPVSVILSKTQVALSRERSAAEYQQALQVCQRAANRMRRLTENLLTLSRYDAGLVDPARDPMDLAALAADCASLLEDSAAIKGITVDMAVSPAPVNGNADQLTQVITNLLNNAIQHGGDGTRIAVQTRVEGNHAVLSVSDTGPGIAPEHLSRIFDRFYRGDAARHGPSSGLGLSIARTIVEGHGGAIAVVSQLGEGAVFTVRLPKSA